MPSFSKLSRTIAHLLAVISPSARRHCLAVQIALVVFAGLLVNMSLAGPTGAADGKPRSGGFFLGDDGKYHPNGSFRGNDGKYHPKGWFLGDDGKYHPPGSFLGDDNKYHRHGAFIGDDGEYHHQGKFLGVDGLYHPANGRYVKP